MRCTNSIYKIDNKNKFKNAFTLVEILIVVIIIGLLAGVGVKKLGDAKDRAEINFLKTAINQMDKGMERYKVVNGTFPTIPVGTPEERVIFILETLDSADLYVDLERKYNVSFENVMLANIPTVEVTRSTSATEVIETNRDARKGAASGTNGVVEILVDPAGEIVYPQNAVVTLGGINEGEVGGEELAMNPVNFTDFERLYIFPDDVTNIAKSSGAVTAADTVTLADGTEFDMSWLVGTTFHEESFPSLYGYEDTNDGLWEMVSGTYMTNAGVSLPEGYSIAKGFVGLETQSQMPGLKNVFDVGSTYITIQKDGALTMVDITGNEEAFGFIN